MFQLKTNIQEVFHHLQIMKDERIKKKLGEITTLAEDFILTLENINMSNIDKNNNRLIVNNFFTGISKSSIILYMLHSNNEKEDEKVKNVTKEFNNFVEFNKGKFYTYQEPVQIIH